MNGLKPAILARSNLDEREGAVKEVRFLNLTNGLELLGRVSDPHFVRIQSTACEQKRWGPILADLGYDFLLHAASGARCVVFDLSAKKLVPRSIYQGIPWARYALHRAWFGAWNGPCLVKKVDVVSYFARCWDMLDAVHLCAVRYAERFVIGEPEIEGVGGSTAHDGDDAYFRDVLGSLREMIG